MSASHETWMLRALEEAAKGSPSPNPHVGAAIVDGHGALIAVGHCARSGAPHAEIMALRAAGERARGATMYVTLEPHNHHGKTPPCTEAILEAGIRRVVVGVRDPNPRVDGAGIARLVTGGVEVLEGVLAEACASIVAPFEKHVRTGRPYLRLKLAATLDGRIATKEGASRWITGPESRTHVHALRRATDAVVVGIGTALADDPSLLARDAPVIEDRNDAVRVVIDRRARLPLTSQLVTTAQRVPTWIVCGEHADTSALERAGVVVLRANTDGELLSLDSVLDALGSAGLCDVLVEGGAKLAGSLLQGGHVDELLWFVAPTLFGAEGFSAVIGPSPATPDVAPRFALMDVTRFGADVMLRLRPRASH
jgi:diaminohydroxyphosphoribosylaminopyrimidine deaminase / 5-amino-6-(5-phosphoribosylamino)uracil reductase